MQKSMQMMNKVGFQKSLNPLGNANINKNGDVAQLARALDWQSRGRGFESLLLHNLLDLFPMKGISGFGYLIWAIVIVDILCQIYEYHSY